MRSEENIASRELKKHNPKTCHSEHVSESIQFQTLKFSRGGSAFVGQVQGDERVVFPHAPIWANLDLSRKDRCVSENAFSIF